MIFVYMNTREMNSRNLLFFVQPNEAEYVSTRKQMRTYMNRFIVNEDDQFGLNKCTPMVKYVQHNDFSDKLLLR